MSKPVPVIRRKIRAFFLPYLLRGLSLLPLKVLYKFACGLAFILYYTPNPIKKIAQTNITLCFPDKNPAEQTALLKSVLQHNAATILELSFIWLNRFDRISQHIIEKRHDDTFAHDLNTHSQMIFITPHQGCWELSGLYASTFYPLAILYRPSRLGIDDIMIQGRSQNGAIQVATTAQGIREMMRALKEGRSVGILPDQDPGSGEGIFSNFFGIPVKTIVLVSRLAQKYKIPAYIVSSTRNLTRAEFSIEVTKISDLLADPDIQTSVDTLNLAVETVIRKHPEQYLWTYKRFKTTPPGAEPRY